GESNLSAIKIVNRAGRILTPTVLLPVEQAGYGIKTVAAFESPHQLAKGYLTFPAHDEVYSSAGGHISVGRQTGIVSPDHNFDAWPKGFHELDDFQRGLALEGHHGEAKDLRLTFAHQFLDGCPYTALCKNKVGDRHAMVRVNVAGQRGKTAIRHAHSRDRHVLERIGHRKKYNVHADTNLQLRRYRSKGPPPGFLP